MEVRNEEVLERQNKYIRELFRYIIYLKKKKFECQRRNITKYNKKVEVVIINMNTGISIGNDGITEDVFNAVEQFVVQNMIP